MVRNNSRWIFPYKYCFWKTRF